MLVEVLSTAADWTWILTAIIGLITLFLVKHVLTVRSLPPGPFPLPILGNLLSLRGAGNEAKLVLDRLARKHKDIFTLWLGSQPTVVVCSWDLCREALITKRNDFSGRIIRHSTQIFLDNDQDVIFSDFGPCWETLRKVLHLAVRKYAVSEKLPPLITEVVDTTVEAMLKENGKPLDSNTYVYLILYNALASSAFGKRFKIDDSEFIHLRKLNDDMNETVGVGLPSDAVPMLKWFYGNRINEIKQLSDEFKLYIKNQYDEHKSTYQKGVVRDFTDAVIAARQEAEEEGKENAQFLTDGNQVLLLTDLFSAGTDTTRVTLLWIILLMCDNPEVQRKMAAEIDENIGSRPPTQDDRKSCHYVYAVITETLRYKPVIDFTLEHKATCDTEIGNYKIPKDTSCLFHIVSSHFDEANFEDPGEFKPERFLEPDGRFTNARLTGYMPFGLGRRACPGEKLALADVFLIITRLLQRCTFELEGGPGSVSLKPTVAELGNFTQPYNLIVKKRNVQT